MPEKQEVLDSIKKNNYTANEVRSLVNSVKTSSNYTDKSEAAYIKVGDVFISQVGAKTRPFCVISVRESQGIVIAVPLTTTNDELALLPYTSRFFGKGWFTSQLMTCKIDFVKDNFAGVLENREAVREVKKELKKFYKGIL